MKKALLIGSLALLAAAASWWVLGRPAYRHYKENRALELARQFLAKGDVRNASLSARQALQMNRRNLAAWQIMAELAERTRSPQLLDFRRTIVELSPSVENKLRLASTALRSESPPYPLATQTLQEVAGSAQDRAGYHVAAAELALKLHRLDEAEAHFQQAVSLEPSNEVHRLNLAVLELESTNAAVAARARTALEQLRDSPKAGAIALRWLLAERLRNADLVSVEVLSEELLRQPQANLDDRLQYLVILQQGKKPEFPNALKDLQAHSMTNATAVYAISSWMLRHHLQRKACQWLTNCPAKVQGEQPVPLAFAEAFMAAKDWKGLESYLQPLKWGELEFLRLAFLSRAQSQRDQARGAEARWRRAVQEAADRFGPLVTLLGLATRWERDQAKEELLWRIAQRFPSERWAMDELDRTYKQTGNTRGLNRLYGLMHRYDAQNLVAQNNLAATSLLLQMNVSEAHEMARNLYRQHAEDPIIASTYAYSLLLQGRTNDALAAFERLKPEQLDEPSVALYYGVVLSANSQTNKAAKCFGLAKGNLKAFLPEEKALLAATPEPLAP